MLRYLRYFFLGLIAVVVIYLALANRALVTVRLLPDHLASLLGRSAEWRMPLFLVIIGALAVGVLVGFTLEWVRGRVSRHRARVEARRAEELQQEVATLRERHPDETSDEVLAMLEPGNAG